MPALFSDPDAFQTYITRDVSPGPEAQRHFPLAVRSTALFSDPDAFQKQHRSHLHRTSHYITRDITRRRATYQGLFPSRAVDILTELWHVFGSKLNLPRDSMRLVSLTVAVALCLGALGASTLLPDRAYAVSGQARYWAQLVKHWNNPGKVIDPADVRLIPPPPLSPAPAVPYFNADAYAFAPYVRC